MRKQRGWSPYQYGESNPILFNDPTGDSTNNTSFWEKIGDAFELDLSIGLQASAEVKAGGRTVGAELNVVSVNTNGEMKNGVGVRLGRS